ncbi:MAG: 16S rRNA (adenine(1518)-N(6)/adenine(1519)-N(6))-dimethyltransferase RsmA [Candidatus Diapherotrites archaeon]|nr:16S rRNA (adenine(1518)-N(6)/adenine(1519)-N(6))-dimethyltransferase RsmA [Candidatus Diapherotrites archaeon]
MFEELQNLMVKYRFSPRKKLAQNFVINQALVEELVKLAGLKKTDKVLEIGAGTGFLTRELQKKCKVIAFELDKKLCGLLEAELPKKNLELRCCNFLEAKLPSFNKVVSLPPYMHSTEIMYRIFEADFETAVLVLQREFAEKLVALPGFCEYNALTVLTQHRYSAKIVERISHECFFPRPQSDSAIVLLSRLKTKPAVKNNAEFTRFVKAVFRFQNKNMRNALIIAYPFVRDIFGANEKKFSEKAAALELRDVKATLVEVKEFEEIFNRLKK